MGIPLIGVEAYCSYMNDKGIATSSSFALRGRHIRLVCLDLAPRLLLSPTRGACRGPRLMGFAMTILNQLKSPIIRERLCSTDDRVVARRNIVEIAQRSDHQHEQIEHRHTERERPQRTFHKIRKPRHCAKRKNISCL